MQKLINLKVATIVFSSLSTGYIQVKTVAHVLTKNKIPQSNLLESVV